MAYSRSIVTLHRVRPLLRMLEEGKECEWEVPAGQELKFAQRIREALFVAKQNSGAYPELASAYDSFSIVRDKMRDGLVQAVRKDELTKTPLPQGRSFLDSIPVTASRDRGQRKQVMSVEALYDAWEDGDRKEMLVAARNWDAGELMNIFEWCAEKQLMFFLAPDGSIRVTLYNEEEAMLAWEPSDLN